MIRLSRLVLLSFVPVLIGVAAAESAPGAERPNILWLTCEDISSNIRCFGDEYAVTPNIDRLASQGVRYTNAFAPIGVCAPARSSLILGMYAPSAGSQHMRCQGTIPPSIRTYSEVLRKGGYYCTNNSKQDYNFRAPKSSWDESSRKAHWKNRKEGQPFFAIFNFTTCHESQIRLPERRYRDRTKNFTPAEFHDPARAPVPPYHPNTPEVRKDWARYADMITFMDKQVGAALKELEDAGLADETIVFWYSDHGAGMPRSKRWLYDSSLKVPFVVRFPGNFKHLAPGEPGSRADRIINFVDLGPTALSLAGVEIPDHMQGVAFLGKQAGPPRQYTHGFRDRMDERYDMIRCVRDKRYKYIRNFMPHVKYAQYISYMYQMPTMQVWQRMYDAGELKGPQKFFFEPKATEELYDTLEDPHEVANLANDPAHRETLERMRKELRRWQKEIKDLGLLSEGDLRSRFGGKPQYTAVRENPDLYPMDRLFEAADLANSRDPEKLPELVKRLDDEDASVRFWGAVGCTALGKKAAPAEDALRKALKDSSGDVRAVAAEALCKLGKYDVAVPVLVSVLKEGNDWERLRAANILDHLDGRARSALEAMKVAAQRDKNGYVKRVMQKAVKDLAP